MAEGRGPGRHATINGTTQLCCKIWNDACECDGDEDSDDEDSDDKWAESKNIRHESFAPTLIYGKNMRSIWLGPT